MLSFRNLCCSLKHLLSKVQQNSRNTRRFCSYTYDLKDFIKNTSVQKYFDQIQSRGLDIVYSNEIRYRIDQLLDKRKDICGNLQSLNELEKNSKEDDFLKMIYDEKSELEGGLSDIEVQLLDALAPQLPNCNDIMIEISAGVGGQEAMLFASELQDMYLNYIDYQGWVLTYLGSDFSDMSGLRKCTMFVEGRESFGRLRHESGIHRVQRIPATERHGRLHTSTVAVAVFPRPTEIDVRLNEKDLSFETMRSSGAGGQHVNKTESAVRLTHLPTGLTVECQEDRSQIKNREIAKAKLCARLYELQQREQSEAISKSRKSQIGTSARSDKIRTYNFPQDRITDHRIGRTLHNMSGFLEGGQLLDSLLVELVAFSEKERYELFVSSLNERFVSSSSR